MQHEYELRGQVAALTGTGEQLAREREALTRQVEAKVGSSALVC